MIETRILKYMNKHNMLLPRDVCLIGLSGGADSVCLLLLLKELQEKIGYTLQAVHVNHNLRGEEAMRDAGFSKELCHRLNIAFYEYSYPVEELSAQHHVGTEEMGRIVRKEAYEDCMRKHGATKLALAHHQNDLAETFLFHLARGTSLGGLAAIRPVRGNVIRPLLCMNRKEIEQYLREREIAYCEDSTNAEDDYTRNQIRHHVLSYLTDRVNPATTAHIAAVSEDILEVQEFLEEQAKQIGLQETTIIWKQGTDEVGVDIESIRLGGGLFQAPFVLRRMILLSSMETLCGKRRDITKEHVERVLRLWEAPVGKQLSLPHGMLAIRNYEDVELVMEADGGKTDVRLGEMIEIPVDDSILWGDFTIKTRIAPYKGELIPEKAYTKWFDYDRIKQNAVFRTRKSGDYLVINTSGGRKKLKDYLIDSKIPRKERDHLLLLAEGNEVLWVVGYRMGESAKISGNTKQMIEIHVTGGNTNE
ncbi:MAG TPA: tRNA lysidine(34) synthetase TilS [Candidatus Pelethocola excrementipullorum]|nr:tRNA lysidine(34) synthetase TilS [Candidatus Pelethocola excrementipullorum]